VHRIVRGMYLQMGRIADNEGSNSFYAGEFADESFHVKHTEVGLLGMCKRSGIKHSNETQFYITLGAPLEFLDNENVVFGRVISGMDSLSEIGQLETVNEKSAQGPLTIFSSGKFTL
jgi:cyclophilin family peptidyl-prolyl cis-trans isomerase